MVWCGSLGCSEAAGGIATFRSVQSSEALPMEESPVGQGGVRDGEPSGSGTHHQDAGTAQTTDPTGGAGATIGTPTTAWQRGVAARAAIAEGREGTTAWQRGVAARAAIAEGREGTTAWQRGIAARAAIAEGREGKTAWQRGAEARAALREARARGDIPERAGCCTVS